ncbi:hypothetical protein EST38_g4761 [Candolleomyces aberdarensis]|uniref:Uncharacterized protein n=1 Tax=Candolleomyces aberdarensis TaxID=2316362 RepID=A0A4Q2DP38_9AGAR|nr:hypothetical protein EST38_g4761 [Candolleomyces aberdarensis]
MALRERDVQIAQLEKTLIDLITRQNAHLHINQFPPEILGEIFSFASGLYDSLAKRKRIDRPSVPTPAVLCRSVSCLSLLESARIPGFMAMG